VSLNVVQNVVALHAVVVVHHPLDVAVTLPARIVTETMTDVVVITVLVAPKTGKYLLLILLSSSTDPNFSDRDPKDEERENGTNGEDRKGDNYAIPIR